MNDLRQTPAWAKYLESIGWEVEKIGSNYYFLKKLPVLGYLLKVQRPKNLNLKVIDKLTKKYKIWKISIEPLVTDYQLLITNYKLSKSFSLPTKTLQIDLTKSQEKLLSEMSPKTRYNTRLAARRVRILKSTNINEFVNFWRKNFEKKRFPILSQKKNIIALYKAFGKNANLLIAKNDSKIIAGLLILRTKDISYYMYAAASDEDRKHYAPTLLTWKAILLAKKSGCKIFDFDGIYDERFPLKSWQGFTRFKKGFGGKEIIYPGSFVKTKLF